MVPDRENRHRFNIIKITNKFGLKPINRLRVICSFYCVQTTLQP